MFELIEREIYVLIYAYNRVVWRLDKIFEEMHILLIGSACIEMLILDFEEKKINFTWDV